MSDGMGDLGGLKIALKRENIVADDDNVGVLGLGDAPNQEMNLARILRKIRRNLLADECIGQIGNLKTSIYSVVISDGDKVHPALEQLSMQLARI